MDHNSFRREVLSYVAAVDGYLAETSKDHMTEARIAFSRVHTKFKELLEGQQALDVSYQDTVKEVACLRRLFHACSSFAREFGSLVEPFTPAELRTLAPATEEVVSAAAALSRLWSDADS